MSDIIRYDDVTDLAAVVERDGYFVILGFYDTAAIEALRARLGALLDADEAKRDADKLPVNINDGGVLSDYTEFMHNLVFPSFVDELFAETVMATLDQPAIAEMMRSVVGPRYRMRADLVRRATGKNDASDAIQLPHEWHRDSGKRLMLVRFGGISSAFPFKDDLPIPQARHSLREIADRFAPRQEVAQTDEILLCRLRSRPRSDAVEQAAAEEKRKVVAESLEERARRVATPPPEVHVPERRSLARSLFSRARRAIGL